MLDLGLKDFGKIMLPDELIGERVIVKRRDHSHDEALWQLIDQSRDFLGKYLFWVADTQSLNDVAVVTDIFDANWQAGKGFECVFIDKESGAIVGAGGIHTVDNMNHWAEWGYYLDHQACGKGYISDVIQTVEQALFAQGIHRIVISCDTDNTASANVARRCGYQQEGILRECKWAHNRWHDNYIFAKINSLGASL